MSLTHASPYPTDPTQDFHKPILIYAISVVPVAQFIEPRDMQLQRRERPKTADEARLKATISIIVLYKMAITNVYIALK